MTRGTWDPQKTAAFWAAVEATSATFVADMMAGNGTVRTAEFEAVAARLRGINPDLLLVVGGHHATRPEIVISAGGIREVFPVVEAVVRAAPDTVRERYDIRAFRPRVPDPTVLRVRLRGQELSPQVIHWDAKRDRNERSRCDLTLYVPGFIDALPADSSSNRNVVESVFLLLDHIVGEWAVEAQIGAIGWKSAAEAHGLPLLATLPDYLDQISAET